MPDVCAHRPEAIKVRFLPVLALHGGLALAVTDFYDKSDHPRRRPGLRCAPPPAAAPQPDDAMDEDPDDLLVE
ncbi:hypothetical protein OAO87_00915 [bacterium]|nr:hypothetical protein [bacterium]